MFVVCPPADPYPAWPADFPCQTFLHILQLQQHDPLQIQHQKTRPIIRKIQRLVIPLLRRGFGVTAVADGDVQKKLRDLNVEARSSSPEQASALLAADIRRWGEVIVRARIPLQQ